MNCYCAGKSVGIYLTNSISRPNVCAVEEISSSNGGLASHRERGWPIDDRQHQHRTCGQNTLSDPILDCVDCSHPAVMA